MFIATEKLSAVIEQMNTHAHAHANAITSEFCQEACAHTHTSKFCR